MTGELTYHFTQSVTSDLDPCERGLTLFATCSVSEVWTQRGSASRSLMSLERVLLTNELLRLSVPTHHLSE